MDSNHRYPAPKAGAIAARRHPVNERDSRTKMESKSIDILKILDSYYPEKIEFIKKGDPFRFLCTVILSASSTDAGAEKAEENLHSALDSPEKIAAEKPEVIEELIKSAGLKKGKARSIKALAEVVVREKGIPEDIESLTRIPGIGVKTANCYLEYLGKPAVIVDTHVARVAKRLGITSTDNRDASYLEIRRIYDEADWSRISMTLNLHGRKICHARKPECIRCPLSSICPSKASFCKES